MARFSQQRLAVRIRKAVRHPGKAYGFAVRKIKEKFLWDSYYALLREPKVKSTIPWDCSVYAEIRKQLLQNGFTLSDFTVDVADYKNYLRDAEYHLYPDYCAWDHPILPYEKTMEHYLAARLLELSAGDVYVDVGSGNSPAAEIYQRLYGVRAYRQDQSYTEGIHGNQIGGEAGNMPVADGFATKMALHCSLDNFENDSDIRFFREANRVLRSRGKICVLPLYLFTTYAIQTDPAVLPKRGINKNFDSDAVLYCNKGWGNRYGRAYDVPQFIKRIRGNLGDLRLRIYEITNAKEVDASCYIKFAAIFQKP
ncbi:MAG: hypothetical protein HY649_05735 [Acidobacteria bacterium]|nr:hypothetical protein [Acidobacteriota bacterium]